MKHSAFGSVRRRGKRPGYYVRFTWQGKLVERNGGPTLGIARANLAKAHALLASGAYDLDTVLAEVFGDGHGSRLSFAEAAPAYLAYAAGRKKASTLEGDTQRLRLLCDAPWAKKRLGSVTPKDLMKWVVVRQTAREVPLKRPRKDGTKTRTVRGASGATINRDLALASALYRWAIRCGYVEENPIRKVERFSEKGRAREVYLSSAEARDLIQACSRVLRPLVMAALHTGARRTELLSLEWRSVDLNRGTLYIEPESEKAGRGRSIPLTQALLGELGRLKSERARPALDGSDPVFADKDGHALTGRAVGHMFKGVASRSDALPVAKRSCVTFHTLRHTAASLMVAGGVPLFDVAKVLGHSTLAVTMRYAHFAPEAARGALERLGQALEGDGESGQSRCADAL